MDEVQEILKSQRTKDEARDILIDLERLNGLPENRKNRWVWELLQNAKDVAEEGKPLKVIFELKDNALLVKHNGKPFSLNEIIALMRKTSTKSPLSNEGNTGKFGTGFLTTHILNKIVNISGAIKKGTGYNLFSLCLDRTPDTPDTLISELESTFTKIDEIYSKPENNDVDTTTVYDYKLDDYAHVLAKQGLLQLENNLPFILLINRHINSIEIKNYDSIKSLSLNIEEDVFSKVGFARIINNTYSKKTDMVHEGILFLGENGLILGIHAQRFNGKYKLIRFEDNSHLYKEFPLIGTENFNTPFLIQSGKFQPTETREGIRTNKVREDIADSIADQNRSALLEYVELAKSFCEVLFNQDIENLHLLAESGSPSGQNNLLGKEWFTTNIQFPLRKFLLQQPLVKTISGNLIKIDEAKFPTIIDKQPEEFYSLCSKLFPDNCPNENSYKEWIQIINQDKEYWPSGISLSINDILKYISDQQNLSNLKIYNCSNINWLNDLIKYLNNNNYQHLGEQYAVYPNQVGIFCKKNEINIDPGIDENFKEIALGIGENFNVYNKLLHASITNKNYISTFDIKQFYLTLNTAIGNLKIDDATEAQRNSIIKLTCLFKDTATPKRNEWFDILHELSPAKFSDKIIVMGMDDYQWDTVDKWILKKTCSIITYHKNISEFAAIFFNNDFEKTFLWLNKFIQFVFRNEDSKEIGLKYSIIPTQDGFFKTYDDKISSEDDSNQFDDLIKDLSKEYVGIDPRSFLIDNRIVNENFRKISFEKITRPLDDLLGDPSSIDKVKEGNEYNELFHKINNWFDEHSNLHSLFPIFEQQRSLLHLTAFGEGASRQYMRFMRLNKPIEELEELSKIDLSTEELKKLVEAANSVGGSQILIDKAKEIIEDAEENRWRKIVGNAAEEAFKQALEEVEPIFKAEKTDRGKDYTLKLLKSEREFFVEIKSTVEKKETVKMTPTQGETAKLEKERYALSVITRPSGTTVTKDYFIEHSKFNIGIGFLIGDKIDFLKKELNVLTENEEGDVIVSLDKKSYSINVRKKVWGNALSFNDFVDFLRKYFEVL